MAFDQARWDAFDPQTGNLPTGVPTPFQSLGYQILRWAEKYIVQPDGENAGEPWRFTKEQKRFILWMYAIDQKGRWLYRDVTLRRAKGWGKTPLLAALAIIEFIGPARFSHWDPVTGRPIAVPVPLPLVQLAAVSLEQTANTRDMIRGMLANSPAEAQYGLELGKERIQFSDGRPGRIEPVAASSRTLEGARPTFVLGDETHHWIQSNGGHAVFKTLRRNVNKSARYGARIVQTTNAFNPNEDSVAQRTFESVRDGKAKRTLYDSVEGYPLEATDLQNEELVIEALKVAYGDSWWASVEELAENATDPLVPEGEFFRFYLNQIAESAEAWMAKEIWTILEDQTAKIRKKDLITIGFDGSLYHDSTAVIGCRVSDGKLFVLGLWERPDELGPKDEWEVPVHEVVAVVDQAFRDYNVAWMYGDPSHWQNVMGDWSVKHSWRGEKGKREDVVFQFSPQRERAMANAVERFETACRLRQSITHDGDARLTTHIVQASVEEKSFGKLIRKEHPKSKRKIDAAMAAVLAYEARAEAIAAGRIEVRRGAKMTSY
jgi:phage terminase large subunit-like protein